MCVNSKTPPPTAPSLVHKFGVGFTLIHIAIQLFLPYSHGITKVNFYNYLFYLYDILSIDRLRERERERERDGEKERDSLGCYLLKKQVDFT